MQSESPRWDEIETLIAQLIAAQQQELLKHAREIIPHATSDDVLQPNDFLELETNPYFRYEEGMLHGMQSLQSALRALKQDL